MSWWHSLRSLFRRRAEGRERVPTLFRRQLARLTFWPELSETERVKLAADAHELAERWRFEGCGGLEVTADMRVAIAGEAALLVLGLDVGALTRVPAVLVYPKAFSNPLPRVHPGGVVSEGTATLGEAWTRGPVVLAWDEVRRALEGREPGRNLVWHEFAHQLDARDGAADGRPPLEGRIEQRRWYVVLKGEYDALRAADARAQSGAVSAGSRATLLDTYGATSPAEFFAVATEAFFGRAAELERAHPELYRALADFYAQDPARRAVVRNQASRI